MSRIKKLEAYTRAINRLKIPEHTPGEISSHAVGYNKGFRNGVASACAGILGGIILAAAIGWILLRNGAPG